MILDNLSIHSASAAKALRDRGCRFLFPPPDRPDLNPIEIAFAILKAHLRRVGARTFTQLITTVAAIGDLFTPEECSHFLRRARYASTQTHDAVSANAARAASFKA